MKNLRSWPTITLWQPWATMIALGHKTIETRTHSRFMCLHGFSIAIHAGKRFDSDAFRTWPKRVLHSIAMNLFGDTPSKAADYVEYCTTGGHSDILNRDLRNFCPKGAIVALAKVREFRRLNIGDSEAACCDYDCEKGLTGLFLEDVHALNVPVPARGAQGIWYWTPPRGWSVETHTVAVKQEARG